jgi:hypothetical protein
MEGVMSKERSSGIGRAAALAVAASTILFALSLLWELVNLSEFAKNLGYVASIFIALSVVIMMAGFYESTRDQLKIYGLLALVSAVMYAPLCIGTYFLQLSAVALNPLDLSSEVLKAITFKPGSPMFAMDMLGYGFLCLSTLAAGFALVEARHKALRVLCFFHGALVVPTIASPIISGLFLTASGETDFTGHFVLLFWCLVFVPIGLLFMRYFKEGLSAA